MIRDLNFYLREAPTNNTLGNTPMIQLLLSEGISYNNKV